MALQSANTSKKFRAIVLGLLALAALAACGSEPEPEPAAVGSDSPATSSAAPPVEQQVVQPPAATAPPPPQPTMPVPTPIRPAPTLALAANPFLIQPPPTPAGQPAIVIAPAAADQPPGSDAESPETGPDYANIGPDATWGDVYDTFSEEEQECIRAEMGDERLEQILEKSFSLEGLEGEPTPVLNCISDEAARDILLADMTNQFAGLTPEQETCLRALLGNFSPVDLAQAMGPEATPEQGLLMLSFGLGMATCIPELAQGGIGGGPIDGSGPGDGIMQDPRFLWSFATGGWVVTAPAVADGTVYIGSDDHSLYALDAETGSLQWSHATGDVIRSTPTVADGTVYVGSNDNHLYALDVANGAELWSFDTGAWVQYSPAVGNGAVYVATQGDAGQKIVALDAATGESRWVADVAAPVEPTYTPTVIGNRVYVAGSTYGEFFSLDAATGDVAWQAEVGSYVKSGPTVIDGVVYLTVINQAYALNEATGEAIWHVNTEEFPARDFPALVVDGVYFLAPSDKVHALDAATGDELWSYDAGEISTPLVVDEGVVYGASASGDGGSVFALDAATGQETWRESTRGQTIQSLTATDGLLFGESDSGALIAAAGDSGVPVWTFEKGGFSDVRGYTVVDGVVYSAGPNNSVYAHREP